MAGFSRLGTYRRSMARIPVPGDRTQPLGLCWTGLGGGGMLNPTRGNSLSRPQMKPDSTDVWADDTILAQGLANFEEMMSAPVRRMTVNWAGLRTLLLTSLVIGRSPQCRSFFWLCEQMMEPNGSGGECARA